MTATAQLAYDVAAGVKGLTRSETKNHQFAPLRNFKKNVDGADTTGDSNATQMFYDSRVIPANGSDPLDLNGVLTMNSGGVLTLTKVHTILVRASSQNTNKVVIGGSVSNPFIGPFGAGTHTLAVDPGKTYEFSSMAGWPVVNGVSDILNIANSGGGTSVAYDVVITGE